MLISQILFLLNKDRGQIETLKLERFAFFRELTLPKKSSEIAKKEK